MKVLIDGIPYVPAPERVARKGRRARVPFGELLRRRREAHRWSLDDAAAELGLSKTYLWELESGKAGDPSLRVAARIARSYEVALDELAGALEDSP